MGSAGRRSALYRKIRAEYQTGRYPCTIASGPWCTGIGTTPEHVPPLHTAPTPAQWRGRLDPACLPCQCRQGGQVRAEQRNDARRWTF